MTVYQIFPTNIAVRDIELTEQQVADLHVAVESIFLHTYQTSRDQARVDTQGVGNCADPIPVFTKENLDVFPVLNEVKEMFVDGFLELAQSYSNNNFSKDGIRRLFRDTYGQLPVMKSGQNMPAHTHPGTIASAVFYLTDVNNETEGGQLVLRDPSWHSTPGFRNDMEYEVETKAGRLVVFPVHLWHEVRTYFGEKDRVTIVANLSYMRPEDTQDLIIEDY